MVRAAKWWRSGGKVTVFDVGIKQIQSFLVSGVTIDILGECGGSTWLKSPEMRESAWQLDVCN